MKIPYIIFLILASLKIAHADEIKACSSVLPFICQTPDCSDNKKIAALCDGKMSFTEPGTECMRPRIPMGKCTRGKEAPWYIALKGGKHVVLKSAAEISALFAPVTDPQTAQGVALLLTEDFPLFAAPYPTLNNGWCSDQSDPGKWLNRIAAVTTVEKVDKGFQVKLFTITRVKDTDQLLPHTYVIGTDGSIVDHATGTTPLWICPGGKAKKK